MPTFREMKFESPTHKIISGEADWIIVNEVFFRNADDGGNEG